MEIQSTASADVKLADSHAHYNDLRFTELDGGARQLLDRLFSEKVGLIVNSSITPDDSRASLELAESYEHMYATVGVHPEDCAPLEFEPAMTELEALAANPKAVALGETGFDFHCEVDRELQTRWFKAQLELARKLSMPLVIHDRDAHGETDRIIADYTDIKIMLHSFSGSPEWARELVRAGRYISFSGVITFKNAKRAPEALLEVPDELLLIETDCPYLAPHPLRGSLNHSGNLMYTAERIAEIRGCSIEHILKITYENALNFFNLTAKM